MKPFIFYKIKEILFHYGTYWDKLSPSEKDIIDFATKHINKEPKRMVDTNHYSMEYCLAHSAESINERFRQDRTDDIDKQIADMVASHSTDVDLILYRGVCDSVFKIMKDNAKHKQCDLYEKGFLCTSLLKGHELNYDIKLRIYVPAGTKLVYQGNVNDEQYFYEVDVMHGSELKIISADKNYINCKLINTK